MNEWLKYIQIDRETGHLTVQLSGGGAAQTFRREMPASEVVFILRLLAETLERGMMDRLRTADQPAVTP